MRTLIWTNWMLDLKRCKICPLPKRIWMRTMPIRLRLLLQNLHLWSVRLHLRLHLCPVGQNLHLCLVHLDFHLRLVLLDHHHLKKVFANGNFWALCGKIKRRITFILQKKEKNQNFLKLLVLTLTSLINLIEHLKNSFPVYFLILLKRDTFPLLIIICINNFAVFF